MGKIETLTYFKDCMASDKNQVILEFWDCKQGRWTSYEATRTAPGIAVTKRNSTVRFNENRLTESDRQLVANKAIEKYNETAERYEAERKARSAAKAAKTTAKAANVPSASSEYDFAVGIMNKFGLEPEQVKEIMDLCKARYSASKSAELTKEEKLKSLFN